MSPYTLRAKTPIDSMMNRFRLSSRRFAPICLYLLASMLVVPACTNAEVVPVRPALHWAENGLVDIAALLIDQGADPNETDHFGNTALHVALSYPDMVQLLLESGADVNAKNALGNTPLHLSVADKRVVEVLLAAGARVNARNGLDKTPLHYAMRQGTSAYNLFIVETLILAGAK